MDAEFLLALDMSTQGNMRMRSKMPHPNGGTGLRFSRRNGKGNVVGYHYGFLVYARPTNERHQTETYGKGVM